MEIRSFIAIELPDELKLALKQLQESLRPGRQAGVKWVDPQGVHLTLKFLGNIRADRISDIIGIMEESARGIAPFQLELKDLGAFPNVRRPQVLWVGIGGELEPLGRLQQRLEQGLVPLGFAAEGRPFSPHLTLARLRDTVSPEERQRLGQLLGTTGFQAVGITVDTINLMRSELTLEGARYSRLGSVELKPV